MSTGQRARRRFVLRSVALACLSQAPLPAPPSPADHLWSASLAAAARMPTVGRAQAAGFVEVSRTGRISHWLHPARFDDGHTADPLRPEGFMFDGERAVAVLFVLDRPGDVPPARAAVAGWHVHLTCFGSGGVGLPTASHGCPPGTAPTTSPAMLHVWLSAPPEGRFAPSTRLRPFRCDLTSA